MENNFLKITLPPIDFVSGELNSTRWIENLITECNSNCQGCCQCTRFVYFSLPEIKFKQKDLDKWAKEMEELHSDPPACSAA